MRKSLKFCVNWIKTHKKRSVVLCVLFCVFYFSLPKPLFTTPISTVIVSKEGDLLGARIAKDGQWRFPKSDSIPKKFKICITEFEDAYYYSHFGFNPISILKALKQNFEAGKTVRGGSTITQQIIRLSRKNKKRTYFEKIHELILALRIECAYSKEELLKYYSAYAPFGGNVVGLEAASWRYYNRNSFNLSWAETATLAVLPNAPSLIYPGKNQNKLKQKRDKLLKKLFKKGYFDLLTLKSALLEGLPQKPFPLPQIAPHLLTRVETNYRGLYAKTTIDKTVQKQVNQILTNHYAQLSKNGINNGAILVLDVKTRKVLAYVGNTPTTIQHHNQVDNIIAPRSSGSILKPFLYAGAYNEGLLLPNQLVKDIPTQMANFSPQNFDETYSGLISSREALSRSLNIPAVRLLQNYNHKKFYDVLKQLKFNTLTFDADHYGLSLILGGAECNLWDVTKNFAGLTSTLLRYENEGGVYAKNEFCEPLLFSNQKNNFGPRVHERIIFDVSSIYETFEALKLVNRPKEDQAWQYYNSSKEIVWKTGTSYGFRDAWAVGTTQDYVVGVWIGNSDGEGRPGITGVLSAAPVMFDVFDALPKYTPWISKPISDYFNVEVCSVSGFLAHDLCPKTKQLIPKKGISSKPCPYHQTLHLSSDEQWQVNRDCDENIGLKTTKRFVIPPLVEWFYKVKHPQYKSPPPLHPQCINKATNPIDFVYPLSETSVFLPRNRKGERTDLVLSAVHRNPKAILYWYLDDQYLGETYVFHTIKVQPEIGEHKLTLLDQFGEYKSRYIEVKN